MVIYIDSQGTRCLGLVLNPKKTKQIVFQTKNKADIEPIVIAGDRISRDCHERIADIKCTHGPPL